jgi:mono/diheme cytochrome c family protein
VVPGSDPPRIAPQLNREQFAQAGQVQEADPDTYKQVYDQVYKTIQRGRPGTPMPAWGQTDGGTLNQEQIYELTAMIVHGNREVKPGLTSWQVVHEIVDESIAHGAPTPIPVEAAANVPPELRAGAELFTRQGCAACHATQGDTRLVGPSLAGISERAATRKPGTSAEEYIRESIRDPSAFIVPGFPGPPSLMPAVTTAQVPDDQLDQLVQYLMSLR